MEEHELVYKCSVCGEENVDNIIANSPGDAQFHL